MSKNIVFKKAGIIIIAFIMISTFPTIFNASATESSIIGIRLAQWDECDHYNSSIGFANSESYADMHIGYFTGTHTLGESGYGEAQGFIKHWVEWDCPINNANGNIEIFYDYGLIALLIKGIASGMAHAKIWITFFIDDSQHQITIYDETISGMQLSDSYFEVSELATWSKTLELTQKIFTIGVQTNFELEFSGTGKADIGFAIDHVDNKTKIIEVTWIGPESLQTHLAVSQFHASLIRDFSRITLPLFQETTPTPVDKVSPSEFDQVDELIITWPKMYGDENYDVEPFHVAMVGAAIDAVNVRINVNKFPFFSPEAGCIVPPNNDRPIPALQAAGVPIDNVILEETMTSSVWVRDYGPSFLIKNGELSIVDFNYYIWYSRILDNLYPTIHGFKNQIATQFIANFFLFYQGGNYISDGQGTAFVCWDRFQIDNPKLSQEQVENRLKYFLGLDNVVFLESQVIPVTQYGDQTGHIDMFAKMLDENTFLVAEWRDGDPWTNDEMAEITNRNAQLLMDMGYEVIRIPTIRNPNDPKVIWSYTNSLIINGINKKVVLVSEYGVPEDAEAILIYQNAMPDYEIRAIDSTVIIKFYGAIHCTTITRPFVPSDTVTINVFDVANYESITTATVTLGSETFCTDQYGVVIFKNVQNGVYTLEVSAPDYLYKNEQLLVEGQIATTKMIYLMQE